MPNRAVDPTGIAPPAAAYVHGVVSDGPARLLHTSGVVPTAPDGTVASDVGAQADEIWRTISALLTDADMATTDIVSVTTYVVPGQDLGLVMAARDAVLGGHLAASTLVIVAALARPEWLMEVAIVAAR
ncbi:MAG: RidA family protein [Actinomycetota bacterium]